MPIILCGTKYEAASAASPTVKVMYLERVSGFFARSATSKPRAMLEAMAHNNESAVEVMAAIIAHTANIRTKSGIIVCSIGIRGLDPAGILNPRSCAFIPK